MNVSLSEHQIRSTCRELLKARGAVSGRGLRLELRKRFGSVGKTVRVFDIWREESRKIRLAAEAKSLPTDVRELQERLRRVEAAAAENLVRAELAEFRERAHQDHWALEIDRVKRELEEARGLGFDRQGRGSKPFQV